LNHSGRRAFCWLADEQVDVHGHDDIVCKKESVAVARFAQDLNKRIPSANCAQQLQACTFSLACPALLMSDSLSLPLD
jgi:hypothetical protein